MTDPLQAGREGRLEALLGALATLAGELGREEFPDFFAGLERVRRVAEFLLIPSPPDLASGAMQPLLSAERLAELFGVSTTQVYRMAKGSLKPAAIDLGVGTLRFDPARIKRFLEARRRA